MSTEYEEDLNFKEHVHFRKTIHNLMLRIDSLEKDRHRMETKIEDILERLE